MEQLDPILGPTEMEEMWNASPESPQPAASAASAAPPYTTPKPNGAKKLAPKTVARAEPSKKDLSGKFPAAKSVYQMMETMDRQTTGRTPWAIRESEFSYNMRFDMPGLTRNDVKVWVEDNVLVVEAEGCQSGKVEIGGDTDLVGIDEWPVESYGKYSNRIALPETVNAENVTAGVTDGVLYITVPKARVRSSRIDIRVK